MIGMFAVLLLVYKAMASKLQCALESFGEFAKNAETISRDPNSGSGVRSWNLHFKQTHKVFQFVGGSRNTG